MDSGNAVREAINQGFTRAELGSLADKKVTQVYGGAKAEGTVVASKCTNAIENYQAAVACFVRALPSLQDERSAVLVRNEIKRLLARLGELRTILRQADPTNPLLEEEMAAEGETTAMKNRLLHDLAFEAGQEVQVDDSRDAVIAEVNLEEGTYVVVYDDTKQREERVIESRVRLRPLKPSVIFNGIQFGSVNEAERYRLWSELIESERAYSQAMQHLVKNYIVPCDNSGLWAGSRAKQDTVFTQTAITKTERAKVFGNAEDLAGLNTIVLETLEKRFLEWKAEQRLADAYLETSAMYVEFYPKFAETRAESINVLKAIRAESRASFEGIEDRARAMGAPPLDELLGMPLLRPAHCRRILQSLAQRTHEDHPDMQSIRDAFVMFGRLEEMMRLSLDRAKLEKQVEEVEQQFSPPIKIAKKGRYLVRFSPTLKRIEGSKTLERSVWFFNDLVIVGRKSEWFSVGQYRHLEQAAVLHARTAPEYGPLAFEVSGTTQKFVFVANDELDKQEWLKALSGFIPKATLAAARRKSRSSKQYPSPSTTTAASTSPVKQQPNSALPPPPPPPPPVTKATPPAGAQPTAFAMAGGRPLGSVPISTSTQLRGEHVLGDATLAQKEIYIQKKRASEETRSASASPVTAQLQSTNPFASTTSSVSRQGWYRAQAIADFEPMEIGDLALKLGEIIDVKDQETSPGWTVGRKLGTNSVEGSVPTNYIQRL